MKLHNTQQSLKRFSRTAESNLTAKQKLLTKSNWDIATAIRKTTEDYTP
jgi:hypothetical protein